jgi:hypothetical protein
MKKGWKIGFAVFGVFALAVLAMPEDALAGGNFGGSQVRSVNGGVCKSGKHVQNTKTCKENGGKH